MIKKDFKMCPVTKFIVWLILGLIVCIIGISNVFADTIDFKIQDYQIYYDNNGSSVSQVGQSWVSSFNAYVSNNITTSANSYGAGVVINSGIPIISGHSYSLSFYFEERSNIALSSKNRISLGSSVSNAASNYANGNYNATMITSKVVNTTTLQFAFTANSSNQYIFIPWTTTSTTTQTYVFTSYIINDLGSSGGVSQSDINNSLNSQTNVLNQSITNSQNAIIQNQNENNQELIESNQELLGNCIKNYMTSSDIVNTYNLWQEGNNFQQQTADTSSSLALVVHAYNNGSFVDVLNTTTITSTGIYKLSFTKSTSFNQIMFKLNGSTIDTGILINISNLQNNITYYISSDFFNITQGNIRFKNVIITDINTTTFVPWGDTKCTSKLDETNDAINGLNDTMNDDNVDSSSWSNFFNNFTTNTFGLTSIITAPLNLIQSLTTTSCTDLQLPLPYLHNKYLTLPCMTTIYSQYFGTFFTLYQTITYGIIAYWVCVRIFNLVKDFKNPDHDEIEVVDL